jgi:hypothetical protein
MMTGREFVTAVGATGAAIFSRKDRYAAMMKGENGMQTQNTERIFWPNGARLAVSISMMFEGGGQPISGAGGPIPEPKCLWRQPA